MGLFSSRKKTIITVGANVAPLFEIEKVPTVMDRVLAESYPMVSGIPSREPIEVIKDLLSTGSYTQFNRLNRVIMNEYPPGKPYVYVNPPLNVEVAPDNSVFDITGVIQLKNRGQWYLDSTDEGLKKSVAKASKILGLDPDSISSSFEGQDGQLWGCNIIAGVGFNTEDPAQKEYIYRFVKKLHDTGTLKLFTEEKDLDQISGYQLEISNIIKTVTASSGVKGSVTYSLVESTHNYTDYLYDESGFPLMYFDEGTNVFVHQTGTFTKPCMNLTVTKQIDDNTEESYLCENIQIYVPIARANKYTVGFACPEVEINPGSYYEVTVKGTTFRKTWESKYQWCDSDTGECTDIYSWSGWSNSGSNGYGVSGTRTGNIVTYNFLTSEDVTTRSFEANLPAYTVCTPSYNDNFEQIGEDCVTYPEQPRRGLVEGGTGGTVSVERTNELFYTTLVGIDATGFLISGRKPNAIDDSLGYFPIDYNILKGMNGLDRLRVSEVSWLLGTNVGNIQVIRIKWYQTGIFKLVTLAVIVVISIYNPALGAKLFTAWMISMAINIALMQISNPKIRAALQLAYIVYSVVSGNWQNLAELAVHAVNAASVIQNYVLTQEYSKLVKDYESFMNSTQEELDRIEELRDILGLDGFSDIIGALMSKKYFETPEEFFSRVYSDPVGSSTSLEPLLDLDRLLIT